MGHWFDENLTHATDSRTQVEHALETAYHQLEIEEHGNFENIYYMKPRLIGGMEAFVVPL